MENINSKSNVFEEWVVFDMSSKRAVVIKEDVVRLLTINSEGAPHKLLHGMKWLNLDKQEK